VASNKRKFRRVVLRTVMTATDIITPHGSHVRHGYQLQLEDLSAGGLRYTSKFAIPVGTRLDLVFQLAERQVRGTVEVVRTQPNPAGNYDIGCKFVEINTIAQEEIIRFVTLSSVRQAQPSSFYTQTETRPVRMPITCANCRCAPCAEQDVCRACSKPNCGKRYCRMYVPRRPDLRRRGRS
jgi:hypothetical protein